MDNNEAGLERLYTLRNARGMHVTISALGAALVSWWAPDRYGQIADVLLGYGDLSAYVDNQDFFGAVVGRWANRIRNGQFLLDGQLQQVGINDRGNHLHGADHGFHRARWRVVESEQGLRMKLASPHGEGGFNGNLQVTVHYQLQDDGSLVIDYEATSDAPTALNLTSHPYFNLNGGTTNVGRHVLQIHADQFMKIDATGIAVESASVEGTPFDFRQPTPIGTRLAHHDLQLDSQLRLAGGFDHYYCVRHAGAGRHGVMREVARVSDPDSGRVLQVLSTEDGVQFYSGNSLGKVGGKGRRLYAAYDGFCLEAQACPDQINGPYAEEVTLRPGGRYRQTTIYRLTVQD